MKYMKATIAAVVAAGLAVQVSATVFYQDYEPPTFVVGDIVGQEGWSGDRSDNGDPDGSGLREVVTVASVPVAGATGTQFARFSTPSASASERGSVGGWTAIADPSAPLTDPFTFTGQIGFSGALVNPGNFTSLALLNLNNTNTNIYNGIFFGFSSRLNSLGFVYRNGDNYEVLIEDGLIADQFYSFKVEVRPMATTSEWDITVYDENGDAIASQEGISARGPISSFDLVSARLMSTGNDNAAIYFDNLVVVPEPGAVALVICAIAAVTVLHRRRR